MLFFSDLERRAIRYWKTLWSTANFEEPGKAFSDGEYGWAKLMAELQLRAFYKQKGMSGVACRIFTAYGERENASHAVVALIAKAAARLDPFPTWGDGLQTRISRMRETPLPEWPLPAQCSKVSTSSISVPQPTTLSSTCWKRFSKSSMGGLMLSKAARQTGGRQEPRRRPQQVSERLNWVPSYTCAKEVERTTNWYLDAFGPRDATIERLLMERN